MPSSVTIDQIIIAVACLTALAVAIGIGRALRINEIYLKYSLTRSGDWAKCGPLVKATIEEFARVVERLMPRAPEIAATQPSKKGRQKASRA